MAQDINKLLDAAQQENARPQYNLAVCYHLGRDGVNHDYEQAAKLFQIASEAGNVNAMSSLGIIYAKGKGVDKDYGKAGEWLQKALDAGDSKAGELLEKIRLCLRQ